MALRKEPQRRYSSVEQFADDIRRHLDGRPVQARTDTFWYRGTKFVRRNRVAVAAGVLVFLTLIAGSTATAWQARVARRQAARAERRFADVRKLARAVLLDYHDAIKDLPGATPVRARLVKDALEYLDTLSRDVSDDPGLQRELATAYERVGDVQGGTMFANLGDTRGAIESYGKALTVLEPLGRAGSTGTEARRIIAGVTKKLGMLLWETGDVAGALDKNREALAMVQSMASESPADVSLRQSLHQGYDNIGMIVLEKGDAAGALEHHRKALEILEALPDSARRTVQSRRSRSVTYEHIGSALMDVGDLPRALESNRQALALRAALSAEFPVNADYRRTLLVSYYNDGEILAKMGRTREALDAYRKDAAIARELLAADPANEQYRGDFAYVGVRLGDMSFALGAHAEALDHYGASLAIRTEDAKADSANLWKRASLIEAQTKIAGTLAALGRRDAALATAMTTRTLMKNTTVAADDATIRSFFADMYANLGDAYAMVAGERGEYCRQAREMFREAGAVWVDMSKRGILSKVDADKPSVVERKALQCRVT